MKNYLYLIGMFAFAKDLSSLSAVSQPLDYLGDVFLTQDHLYFLLNVKILIS